MRHSTLFLDESGKSSLIQKKNEPFILTGVILDDKETLPVEGFFNYIKRKYKIDSARPFHTYDIFENSTTKLSTKKAKSLVEDLADFISFIPIKVNVIAIDKSEFKKSFGVKSDEEFKGSSERKEIPEFPYRIMSSEMFKWFASYLKQNDHIGQIVVDARRGGDFQILKSLNLCKDPKGPLGPNATQLIKEKCNAICFAEKNFLSGGLEITDLISFTAFFHTRSLMNTMGNINLVKLWNEIRKRLRNNELKKLSDGQIKKFFNIGSDGVHKYLKT